LVIRRLPPPGDRRGGGAIEFIAAPAMNSLINVRWKESSKLLVHRSMEVDSRVRD
jgi:hypothetical protein